MDVRAISFDADQTLWDFRSVQWRALEVAAATMIDRGFVPAGSVDPAGLQQLRDEIVIEYRGRPHRLDEVRRASFALALERAGCRDAGSAADEVLEAFMRVRFGEIELYPDVPGSLARLGTRFRLGLLSNGNSEPERCGLPGVFDAVVLGPSLGIEKPDPRAFQAIARRLDTDPGQMVHVGDDWDDIDGANAAGMVSVFVNRDGDDPPFRRRADHEVGNLIDLEHLLTRQPFAG